MSVPVVPAIIPDSAQAVRTFGAVLSFSWELHLDVVDGTFGPLSSWPYRPAGDPAEVSVATDCFTLEVDLMVNEPLAAANSWVAAGADMIVFHVETTPLSALINFCESCTVSVGVSALNDTPDATLWPYLAHADYVQVMGIAQIGSQGQPFDPRSLERIAAIKRDFPRLMISVDGSVNRETIPRLRDAGVNRLIVGSAIVQAADPKLAYLELAALT
jgi:ribulose-phosphate 3-epimerase